jgi:hypothetical protein
MKERIMEVVWLIIRGSTFGIMTGLTLGVIILASATTWPAGP